MTSSAAAETAPPLIRLQGHQQTLGPVPCSRRSALDIRGGEVLVLAGENGAGKSTLIKILGGVHSGFEGTIKIAGRLVRPRSPLEAADLGVAIIFQELSLVPTLTVADNIFLGRPLTRAGFVDDAAQRGAARGLLDRSGSGLTWTAASRSSRSPSSSSPRSPRPWPATPRVIVMDKPTSALNAPEVEKLFALISDLRARGCGIVYITHKMEEMGHSPIASASSGMARTWARLRRRNSLLRSC